MKPPAEARKWVELEGAHKGWATTKRCAGRFTPKLPPTELNADDAKLSYAAWLAGCIDGADLSFLLSLWGLPNPPIGDLDGDGVVDGFDLAVLLSGWAPCP